METPSQPRKRCRRGKKRTKTLPNEILHPQHDFLSVVNLSDRTISPECETALCKGLNLVPTTQCDPFETSMDFEKFFRNLRFSGDGSINAHSIHNQSSVIDSSSSESNVNHVTITEKGASPCRPKSTFCPPKSRNASLDTYCRLVQEDVMGILNKRREYKVYNNLSKKEREALTELKNDTVV